MNLLRHTFVSILIAEGAAVTTVANIIGDTPEMVMKAYAHSLADEELKATKILSSLIKFEWFSFFGYIWGTFAPQNPC